MSTFLILILLIASYFIGSIPFGLILTRLFGYGDIRHMGSGNIGATNVLRTGNKALAAATLAFDALKGAGVIFMVAIVAPQDMDVLLLGLVAGVLAVLGHMFPLWLKFKGGKGVATFFGMITAALPLCGIIFASLWLLSAGITRRSSAGALLACAGALGTLVTFYILNLVALSSVMAVLAIVLLIFYKHRENIRRLLNGTEPKIGQRTS